MAKSDQAFDYMGNYVPPEDLAALRSLVTPDDGCLHMAVEIGTWAGQSAMALSEFYDRVFCIDHWQGNPADCLADEAAKRTPREAFQTFCRNAKHRLFGGITPLVGHSLTYAAIWPFPVDLVFIDADHRYEHVKADIESWWPHVKPGGILCGHDYGVDALPGVKRAVDLFFYGISRPDGPTLERHGRTIWAIRKQVR